MKGGAERAPTMADIKGDQRSKAVIDVGMSLAGQVGAQVERPEDLQVNTAGDLRKLAATAAQINGNNRNGNGSFSQMNQKAEELNGSAVNSPLKKRKPYSPSILEEKQTAGKRDFYTLREDKFFSTLDDDPVLKASEIWSMGPSERSRVRVTLKQLRAFLGINSLEDIQKLREDDEFRHVASQRAYRFIGVNYEIPGTPEEVEETVKDYAQVANNVISAIRARELKDYSSSVEPINDVESEHDPVQLLLIALDRTYTPRARFEAKRKFELMKLAANLDQWDREMKFDDQQSALDRFMSEHVYSTPELKGQLNDAYVLSTFDPETYDVVSVQVLQLGNEKERTYFDPENNQWVKINSHQKLMRIPRRTFRHNGRAIPIWSVNAPKSTESKMLKMIRKGYEDPERAIRDNVRMMGVFDTYLDVHSFVDHLQSCAIEKGSFLMIQQQEDNLKGGARTKASAAENGGDPHVRMFKFIGRMALPGVGPVSFEFIGHTNETLLEYRYKRGRSHEEFKDRENFGEDDEITVLDMLFPYAHYGIDMKMLRVDRIATIREELEAQYAGTD